jgi:hypothetical protein
METKDFFVKELSFNEAKEVNGGFFGIDDVLTFLAVMGAVVYLYEEGIPSFVQGFKEGYAITQK